MERIRGRRQGFRDKIHEPCVYTYFVSEEGTVSGSDGPTSVTEMGDSERTEDVTRRMSFMYNRSDPDPPSRRERSVKT